VTRPVPSGRTAGRYRARHLLRSWPLGAALVATGVLAAACSSTTTASTTPTTPTTSTSTTIGGGQTASAGTSAPVVASATRGSLGVVLVTADGHTLYRLTTDSPTASSCSGACAQLWPPLTVPAGTTPKAAAGLAGTVGTVTRSDGTLQVTYQGHPLYTYASDTTTTDTLGQGVGGVWFVVGAGSSGTSSSTTTSAGGNGY